ncbi:hypothetical protein [Lactiplantibacillus pentosus]|uniref:Uncharacterized protein n=1 Tax=Lactiplantibacillus pentosus TaxID=1589 RepID=A0AAW8VZJ1_LACPE|nr:hypothetical protein [Lactiplantibacillus pentosus]MBO9166154.1 hypothetical protein [Lactiplantibacillus pentosus]MBU7473341.1 hypothetical protein [Lactiplantibacillus pentosus]MBU7528600.1 hypothetical protein [Lactiplantibacillus pentosus]MCE6030955.1 hypothetical protein [Lactiplantibacillus pentosus]MDT6990922.1 hypothetical protein [Lactiplantibacillus pentosus]
MDKRQVKLNVRDGLKQCVVEMKVNEEFLLEYVRKESQKRLTGIELGGHGHES